MEPEADDTSPQWVHIRDAITTFGRLLEPLTPKNRARVLAAAAIISGSEVPSNVVELLSGNEV